MQVGDKVSHNKHPGSVGIISAIKEDRAKISWSSDCGELKDSILYLIKNLTSFHSDVCAESIKDIVNSALEEKYSPTLKDDFDYNSYNGFSVRNTPEMKPFISFSDYNGFESSLPKYKLRVKK